MNPENAPSTKLAPLAAGQTSVTHVFEHARAQGGNLSFSVAAAAVALVGNGFNPVRLARNLLTLSFDPTKLTGGPLDKSGGDTGILQDLGDGTFSKAQFDRMFTRFGQTFTAENGTKERGLDASALEALINANQAERNGNLIMKVIALFELPNALKLYARRDQTTGTKYLSESDLLAFFKDMKFPARTATESGSKLGTNSSLVELASKSGLSPAAKGAALATGSDETSLLSGPAKGLRGMCPFSGVMAPSKTTREAHAEPQS